MDWQAWKAERPESLMTPEETLKEIIEMQDGIHYHGIQGKRYWHDWMCRPHENFWNTVREALSKQCIRMPRTETIYMYTMDDECPPTVDMLVCVRCNKIVPNSDNYCNSCGQKLK